MKTLEPTVGAPQAWAAQRAPVGHFEVLRALPTQDVPAVGPFVFLDHFGPAPARAETLPAHPHAGIEVMTYLLQGANNAGSRRRRRPPAGPRSRQVLMSWAIAGAWCR